MPITYHSKTLTLAQTKWSATERELYAIVEASRKWSVYCAGKIFFHTDHEPLKHIRRQKDPRGKLCRWILELEGLNYEIHYVRGKDIPVPDGLSRVEIPKSEDDIASENKADDHIYDYEECGKLARLQDYYREPEEESGSKESVCKTLK